MAAAQTKASEPIFLDESSGRNADPDGMTHLQGILRQTKLVLFDCDGGMDRAHIQRCKPNLAPIAVLWRSSTAIEAAPPLLTALKEAGIKIAYVTNNSSKPRSAYIDKINSVLVDGKQRPEPATGDIFSSAYATALHLKSLGLGKGDTVMVVGEPGLARELELTAGVTCVGQDLSSVPFDMGSTPHDIQRALQEEPVSAVVVGFDANLSYVKIAFAASHLRYNPKCHFVATNRDLSYPTSAGLLLPGGGTAVHAVEAGSGRLVQSVAGKPSTALMDVIALEHELSRREDGSWPCLMVGDRLDTDIAFACAANMPSLLVLSGVTDAQQALGLRTAAPSGPCPSFVAEDVGVLSKAVAAVRK